MRTPSRRLGPLAHLGFAHWLERAVGDRIGEWDEIVGHHYARAHDYLVELGSVGRAAGGGAGGRRAPTLGCRADTMAREDMTAASRLLQRALGLIEEERPERRELSGEAEHCPRRDGGGPAGWGSARRPDRNPPCRPHAPGISRRRGPRPHGRSRSLLSDRSGSGRRGVNEIGLGWDSEVSRQHAELRAAEDGSWKILDLGSQNGTFVNGERLARRARSRGWGHDPRGADDPCVSASARRFGHARRRVRGHRSSRSRSWPPLGDSLRCVSNRLYEPELAPPRTS